VRKWAPCRAGDLRVFEGIADASFMTLRGIKAEGRGAIADPPPGAAIGKGVRNTDRGGAWLA